MPKLSRDDGFTITELLVTVTIMLLATGAALTTFRNALTINDTAGQLADANQNLRAGTNQLVRDLMMAGRVIGANGVPAPSGAGSALINRPGPPNSSLTFPMLADDDPTTPTLVIPSITTGYQLGPLINNKLTDMVTILTVDEFMPVIRGILSGVPGVLDGQLANDGSMITLPATSPWLVGDALADTQPINVGDLVLFKNANGMAIQTVTSKDATHVYFAQNNGNDWFKFNQRGATIKGSVLCIKSNTACDAANADPAAAYDSAPAMFRALMITYYVDNTTSPATPRLTRLVNHFTPQALAGVVEDLELTYDLVDSANNVSARPSLPYTDAAAGVTYTANMIKKVNIHVGVRSELLSKPAQDYVRNHISTSVDVRSLASVDRYDTSQ